MNTLNLLSKPCYELMRQIPKGKVTTYKQLALKLNTSPRVIGKLCNINPDAPKTPCHRVVGNDGKLVGYAFGIDKKIEMLVSEGIEIKDGKIDLDKYLYKIK